MTQAAILIDGGFFLQYLPRGRPDVNTADTAAVKDTLDQLANPRLKQINRMECAPHWRSLLYRLFYYDARPYPGKEHHPSSGKAINFDIVSGQQLSRCCYCRSRSDADPPRRRKSP